MTGRPILHDTDRNLPGASNYEADVVVDATISAIAIRKVTSFVPAVIEGRASGEAIPWGIPAIPGMRV
jgi:hypothetical protein